jgi:hypothetical protein
LVAGQPGLPHPQGYGMDSNEDRRRYDPMGCEGPWGRNAGSGCERVYFGNARREEVGVGDGLGGYTVPLNVTDLRIGDHLTFNVLAVGIQASGAAVPFILRPERQS